MPVWLGIVFGLMFGLVVGVTLVALPVSTGHGGWIRAEVIGPAIGAFLAAMVGVLGAFWVHHRDAVERKRERKRDTQKATLGALGGALELYGYAHLHLREYQRIAERGLVQPALLLSLQEIIKQTSIDLRHIATADALPPTFRVAINNFTRSFIHSNFPIEFTDEYLEANPPVIVTGEERDGAKILLKVYEALDKMMLEVIRSMHEFADMDGTLEDIHQTIDKVVKDTAQSFGLPMEF